MASSNSGEYRMDAPQSNDVDAAFEPTLEPRKPASPELARTAEHQFATAEGSLARGGEKSYSAQVEGMFDTTAAGQSSTQPIGTASFPVVHWDRYEFLNVLGYGGMGTVFKARDRRILRVVALKFVSGANERLKQRFVQEARTQSRIDHPGICKVLEVGEVEGKAYIAMQYVDGLSLHKAKAHLSLRDKVRIIKETAEALEAAHELGIIHRDIKPANIMLQQAPDGSYHPILMDFGLARDVNAGLGLTDSGAVMGTPWYMSPEQTRGEVKTMDRRTDIYSLGATLYDLLAGKPPFHSETTVDALIQGMLREPQPLSSFAADIPKALDIIVGKCLNKEPAQRYATAKEFAEDLGRFLGNEPILARKLSLLYRLRWRARHNKPAAAAAAALLASLLVLFGYGIRTRIQALHRERKAQEQAALARRLGQAIEHLESFARLAYGMPLHDTRHELGLIRKRMTEIDREMRSYGDIGAGLGHYALGRGHLALHEWNQAHEHLLYAQGGGIKELELDYALGRVLGARYSEALAAAHRSGDHSFFLKRRQELMQEFLVPALSYLERSRRLETVSTSYVEGLIDFYNQHYDAALLHAQMAQRQTPWEYEATKLAGDVYMAQALKQKDSGDYDQAERNFQQALHRYGEATELGRSDYQLYEATAEVVIRQMEMDGLRGQDPKQRLKQALLIANQAIEADPVASSGYAKKAFAYLFVAQQMESQGSDQARKEIIDALIDNSKKAVFLHPADEYTQDILGNGYIYLAKYASEHKADSGSHLVAARKHLALATSLNPRFPWAYNDLGCSYLVEGDDKLSRLQDPTAAYLTSIEAFSKAVAIDPTYLFAYGNIGLAYSSMVRYVTETGKSPSLYAEKTTASASKALLLNKKFLLARGSVILSLVMQSLYELDALTDTHNTTSRILSLIDEFIDIQPNVPTVYQHRAITYYVIARQKLGHRADPSSAVQSGLHAIATCQKLSQGVDGTCASLEAQFLILSAQWRQQQGQPFDDLVNRALATARQAILRAPADIDVLLAVAEARWRAARIRIATNRKTAQEIEDGLAAINQALTLAPGWPRALAVQGGLYALRARTAAGRPERQTSLQPAEAALQRAVEGNPLLRNSYREAFLDIAPFRKLLGGPTLRGASRAPPATRGQPVAQGSGAASPKAH